MKNLWNSKVRKDKGKENRRNKRNRKEQRKELNLRKRKKWNEIKTKEMKSCEMTTIDFEPI